MISLNIRTTDGQMHVVEDTDATVDETHRTLAGADNVFQLNHNDGVGTVTLVPVRNICSIRFELMPR